MKLQILFRVSLLFAVAVGSVGCEQEEPPATRVSPYEEALFLGEVHGLSNGAAYVRSFHSSVFYVAGGVAEEVVGLPDDPYGNIFPLADGTALFLTEFDEPPQLYWLRGPKAELVSEGQVTVPELTVISPEGFLFAENQRLSRELREAQDELAYLEE